MPLAQLLSLHILTNAPRVWGSILPFLKFYLNSFAKSSLITCPSPLFSPFLFMRLYTLSFSVACKSFPCHSYENCRVCTNNSRSGTLRRLVGRQESERQSGRCTRLSGSFFHQSPVTSHQSRHHWHDQRRRMRLVMKNDIRRLDHARGAGLLFAGVQVAVEARKIATGDFQS